MREYSGAVEPAFEGLLKIVTNARIKPTIIAGNISVGMFHPIKAPPKQRDSKMPVLLTAPSKVILSLEGISLENPLKLFNKKLKNVEYLAIICEDISLSKKIDCQHFSSWNHKSLLFLSKKIGYSVIGKPFRLSNSIFKLYILKKY